MYSVLRILFFILLLHESFGTIYHLNASEFDRMPPIHKIDNYDSCFQEPSDVYCKLIFQLVSDEPSELLSMIQEYSKHTSTHFDHTKLKRGVCVTQRCQNYMQNETSVSEATLEGCLNQTFWDDYQLKTRLQQYFCYNMSDNEMKIDNSDIFTGFILLTILVLNMFGSLYDIYCTWAKKKGNSIILSFSIKRNWRNLIRTKHEGGRSEDFKFFSGIRCFVTYGVVYVHTTIIYYVVSKNFYEIESLYSSPFYQLIINGTIMMQSFFVMAGFQLAYQLCVISKHYPLDWSIFPKIICKRSLRLLPAYALVVLLMATWFKFLGPGPFWEVAGEVDLTYCKKNFWTNFLFFNNYVEGPQCLAVSWSIAADMQLYVFGVILMILLRDSRFRKPILTSLVVLGSVIVAIHTYVRDLDPILIVRPTETGHFFATDRSYNEIYRVGHGHVSGYVIGMSLGYYIYEWQQKKNDNRKYSHKLKFLYWSIIPMIAAVVLSGAVFYRDAPRDPAYVRAICGALNKPILAGLIALFIAGLFMKVENVYRKFFELDVWVIPSKLIYSAYLLHFPLFYIFINMQTDLIRITYLDLTAIAIVVTIISFVLAIPLYLFVEAPFSSILNGSKLQQKETATKQNGSNGITKKKTK